MFNSTPPNSGSISGKSYAQLLQERQRGFSEAEVHELLRQVLAILAPLHSQNLSHGSLSLDTLMQHPITLQPLLASHPGFVAPEYLAPDRLPHAPTSPADDIYALGVTLILLLTNQPLEALRQVDGSWNWQEHCLVSDQLIGVLERAIAPNLQWRYPNAMKMLQQIHTSRHPTPSPTIISSFPGQLNASNQQQPQAWKWLLVGTGVTVLLGLVGFGGMQLARSSSTSQPPLPSSVPTATTSSVNSASLLKTTESSAPTTQSSPQVIEQPEVELESEVGADYRRLLGLLKQQQFKEADLETTRLLFAIAGREQQNTIDAASLNRFPCRDLGTMDRLWVRYSERRFGFSIQNQIWQEVSRDATRFADRVGWLGQTNLKDYQDLNFSISAQRGHLPIGDYGPLYISGIRKFNPALENRLSVCGINKEYVR
jgi:hypothetical protein